MGKESRKQENHRPFDVTHDLKILNYLYLENTKSFHFHRLVSPIATKNMRSKSLLLLHPIPIMNFLHGCFLLCNHHTVQSFAGTSKVRRILKICIHEMTNFEKKSFLFDSRCAFSISFHFNTHSFGLLIAFCPNQSVRTIKLTHIVARDEYHH